MIRSTLRNTLIGLSLTISAHCLFGCRGPGPSSTAPERYVRLEALLHLHPAMRVLRERAAFAETPDERTGGILGPTTERGSLPPPLGEDSPAPEGITPSTSLALVPGSERLEDLRAALAARNSRAMRRRRDAAEQVLLSEVAEEEARLLSRSVAEERQTRELTGREIRDLQFREIALRSHVSVLTDEARRLAEEEYADVRERVRNTEAALQIRIAAARSRADRDLVVFRRNREAASAAEIARHRDSLEHDLQATLNEYRSASRQHLRDLPSIMQPALQPANTGIREGWARDADSAGQPPAQTTPNGSGTDASLEASLRARLTKLVEADVRRHVEFLARRHEWRAVYSPRAGISDATQDVAAEIRRDWTF